MQTFQKTDNSGSISNENEKGKEPWGRRQDTVAEEDEKITQLILIFVVGTN